MKTYEVIFGVDLKCLIEIENNEIKIVDAINGWGDSVDLNNVQIIEKLEDNASM